MCASKGKAIFFTFGVKSIAVLVLPLGLESLLRSLKGH